MQIAPRPSSPLLVTLVAACALAALASPAPRAQQATGDAPRFTFDGSWPKLPLPNKWTFGGVQALAVDRNDVVWVSHRRDDLNETENFAALNPPQAECCVKGPAIYAFDQQGNLVHTID